MYVSCSSLSTNAYCMQTECFFLHAKAQASGLNLVNATHVFLCEPLINTAIELQAIARVHRIGQHHRTTVWICTILRQDSTDASQVWMYLIENSVEKSIYEISVDRRMSHIVQSRKGKDKVSEPQAMESQIEAANSVELQEAKLSQLFTKGSGGGELVRGDDVWDCLFRYRPRVGDQIPIEAEGETS